MQNPQPVQIARLTAEAAEGTQARDARGTGLRIRWSNGAESELSAEKLRRNCPCASCLEARGDSSHAKPLAPGRGALRVLAAGLDEETDLREVWPVGNYALGARWGDNHSSGIYTFQRLWELSKAEERS